MGGGGGLTTTDSSHEDSSEYIKESGCDASFFARVTIFGANEITG